MTSSDLLLYPHFFFMEATGKVTIGYRTVNTVRDYLPTKSILNNLNPFGTDVSPLNPFGDDEEDEYDASGKNPFSE